MQSGHRSAGGRAADIVPLERFLTQGQVGHLTLFNDGDGTVKPHGCS